MDAAVTMSFLDSSATVKLYKGMVHAIAMTHTRSRSDAEDVFQNVFLVYHRKQPVFESEERRKAWLIVTTLNCAKQINASSWNQKVVPLHEEHPSLCRHEDADSSDGYDLSYQQGHGHSDNIRSADDSFHFRDEQQDLIFRALQDLPAKYRTVLHLFYFEDQSIAQVSALLGINPGAVKVQLSRGRDMMREQLKGEYFDD